MWSYVQNKLNKQWLWIGVCRRTNQVVGYAIGARDAETATDLRCSLASGYFDLRSYSDRWEAYENVFDADLHQSMDCRGETNHVERCNATLRARLGRLVRKTLSFSKTLEAHQQCIHAFILKYNQEMMEKYMKT